MTTLYKFCDTPQEIYDNVILFSKNKELQRPIIGNHPKYFVHVIHQGRHLFGLSKFIALKEITPESYIVKYRWKVYGGTTQQHIAKMTGQPWIPYRKQPASLRRHFTDWIRDIFASYKSEQAYLMSVTGNASRAVRRTAKVVTPEQLADKLDLQNTMGKVGEKIALAYETARLQKAALHGADWDVKHISPYNVGAGYDIQSRSGNERRYIEVKATYGARLPFFVTSHEYAVLSSLKHNAFIYRVLITDLDREKGHVFQEIRDPISTLELSATIEPVLYKVTIPLTL